MSIHERQHHAEKNLNIKLEALLKESRHEMQERTQTILHAIDSHAKQVKSDVRHHISGLAN